MCRYRNLLPAAVLLCAAASVPESAPAQITAIDTGAMAWESADTPGFPEGAMRKLLKIDRETGIGAALRWHPDGYVEPRHYHTTAAHSIYVLEGRLDVGGVEAGPGHFFHFPPYIAHGPLVALEDAVFLIWTEGPLDIELGDPPDGEGRKLRGSGDRPEGFADPTSAQTGGIEATTIHPPVAVKFQCSEHPLGAEDHVPDALGADCVVVRRDGGPRGNLNSLYSDDGTRNEDWHSWREPLLAPFDGVVLIVQINPETTVPGIPGQGRSSAILFREGTTDDANSVQVAYVHVREVLVSEGDTVRAGQPIARIGNNGSSFNPHVHVGAFRGDLMSGDAIPLQVRFDLEAMGRIRGTVPE